MMQLGWYGNEDIFFRAVTADTEKPWWLLGVEPASPILDVRGVDALAEVVYPDKTTVVKVPVQIKGSCAGMREYYRLHPSARRARVVVLPVNKHFYAEQILYFFLRRLERVRQANIRYDDYLAKLESIPVTGKAVEILAVLTKRAAQRQTGTGAN